jgi:hypothetical protein
LYKATMASADVGRIIEILEDLLRNESDYATSHPEIYYVLGRAYDWQGSSEAAVRNMRRYVEAELSPAKPTDPGDESAGLTGEDGEHLQGHIINDTGMGR